MVDSYGFLFFEFDKGNRKVKWSVNSQSCFSKVDHHRIGEIGEVGPVEKSAI